MKLSIKVVNMAKNQISLTFYEREIIEFRLRCKQSIREIARHLGRSHSVVSRELKRNKLPRQKQYIAKIAQELADKKKSKTNKKKLDKYDNLRHYVIVKLTTEDWSPEEIAGRLKDHPPKYLLGKTISHESIYQYIYKDSKWLYKHLKYKKQAKRQKHYSRKIQKNKLILDKISIHARPKIINERLRIGDWESDSVKFYKQKTALSVQHERKSLLVRFHQINNMTSCETHKAISKSIDSLPQYLFHSITLDNGGEGACHKQIKDDYGIDTYFCDPYCSWQKGGVENTNKQIRYYLPRKTDLSKLTDEDLYQIQEKLNNRPRKKLGYLSPNEYINKQFNLKMVH